MRRFVLGILGAVGLLICLIAVGCVPTAPPTTTTSTTSTVPVACAPGTFSVGGNEPCTPAPPGTYVDTAGAAQATPCAAGSYQPDSGQTSCFLAPIGTYVSNPGASSATPCAAGTTTEFAGAASASDCVERLLAVAYSNVDGIDGYDPAADVLIAKVVDSNVDGMSSVGDTVVTNKYPLDFDAATFGTFQVTSHTVTQVRGAQQTFVGVLDEGGAEFYFEHNISTPSERYIEIAPGHLFKVNIGEERVSDRDWLEASTDAPSAPDTPISRQRPSTIDDPFIEVDLFVS